MHAALAWLYDFRVSSGGGALAVVLYGIVIGGVVGSFLNVVAYRLPLGMSLNRPGSRCPKCKRPIRPWHNIPVLGWLLLRGRCRDCGAPIAARYPAVEALVAAASGIVVWKSLVPVVENDTPAYALNVLAVLLRMLLGYLMFTSALLEFDGNRLPLRLNAGALLLLIVGVLLVPELRPPQPLEDMPLPPLRALAVPAASAIVLGLISWPLMLLPPSATIASGIARFCLLALVALVLGGLAVMFVAAAANLLMLVLILARRFWPPARRLGWAAALLLATLMWLLIAGPHLGSNELAIVGETIVIPGSPWQTLVPFGLLTAVLLVIGRLGHWRLHRDSQSK